MSTPRICLIVAVAQNGVIGRDNQLLWRLKDDLQHFKRLTTGHSIIMGRKTWDSLGRPLPNRRNIVISRQTELILPGAEVFTSLDAALQATAGEAQVFIIGGGEIYRQALPRAEHIYLTEVACAPLGDTFFPPLAPQDWREVSRSQHPANTDNQHDFAFVEYVRES